MPQQTHIKTNIHKIFLVIIFCLVLGFGFGKGEKAEAADDSTVDCKVEYDGNAIEYSEFNNDNIKLSECGPIEKSGTYCNNVMNKYTSEHPSDINKYKFACLTNLEEWQWPTSIEKSIGYRSFNMGSHDADRTSCTPDQWVTGSFINCLLLTILNLMVSLLQLSTALFEWIMAPENITSVIGNDVIYSAWGTVRDVLNVSFIMFLLFSAFATVFQVDKYSYKKIWLNMLLMALLVNFSFPIARFIIDVSNMMMYYFASALGVDAGKTVIGFASAVDLPGILYEKGIGDASTTALFTSVIFIFIFAVTIFTITILFVIRTIALAILIIFSSLAFVGTAIPPLASYASDWWSKLFKYAFFGPIMLFMIYIASTLMTALAKSGLEPMKKIATDISGNPDKIAVLSFFAIPIVILWFGLGIAQSMSIAGAGAVVGKAQGFMKGAGMKFSGYNAVSGRINSFIAKRKSIREDKYNKFGQKWSDRYTLATTPAITGSQKERRDEARKRLQAEKDKKDRKFERDVNEYTDQIKHDTPANLHTELDKLLNKTNKNERDKVMLTAILEKLRTDDDLDMSKLSFVSSGGDVVNEVEKAGGKKLGGVYANKLLKHAPDLSLTSARALSIANEESIAAGTGPIATTAGAMGHFTRKIKGANGAKNLAPGSIDKINTSGTPGAQSAFLENLDHSIVGELVRTNRLSDVNDLSDTINTYLATNGVVGTNIAKINWMKTTCTNPQIQRLGKLIDADAKLKNLLGLA